MKEMDCPVCGERSEPQIAVPGWGEMRRCLSCGLIYASPMRLPGTPHELFSRAYKGQVEVAGMRMFRQRLLWRADLLQDGSTTEAALNSVHRRALAYIRQHFPPASLVLDIGCGTGSFLAACRRLGYSTAGLEVAGPAVELLHRKGYRVFHGTIEQLPQGWADPDICVSFSVLHHVEEPLRFLKGIRVKFGRAPLIISEHYFGESPRRLSHLNLPPRRLSAWTPRSLQLALEKAGYRVESVEVIEDAPYHPILDGTLAALYERARAWLSLQWRARLVSSYLQIHRSFYRGLRAVLAANTLTVQHHLLAVAHPATEGGREDRLETLQSDPASRSDGPVSQTGGPHPEEDSR
jgi:SAM-dependent methyltransferase